MAQTRVRILRHVTGENVINKETNEKETLTKGSVVDVSEQFGRELIASKAAEEVDKKEKTHSAEIEYPAAAQPAVPITLEDVVRAIKGDKK